jgi:hypothetical chaperone protein
MRLGIDFGTTNSAVATYDGQTLSRWVLDSGNDNQHVLPSLLYIDRSQQSLVGTAAATEYLQRETGRPVKWEKRKVGEIDVVASGVSYVQTVHIMVDTAANGRLLQYVKTALRDPRYEGTQVFDRFYTIDELIAIVLRSLKTQAEKALGEESREVVLGRPVRFAEDPAVGERAQEILYKAACLAGFDDIRFELEPIGAAYYYHRSARDRKRAFIFDFGGGTLDLTVAELGGTSPPRVLATHGILVGGDDLDRRIMQSLVKYFGGPAAGKPSLPGHLMDALDNWQTMPILARGDILRTLDDYKASGVNPREIAALKTLVTRNLGFKLFREIEQVKQALSEKYIAALDFEFEDISLHEHFTRRQFEGMIHNEVERVQEGIRHILAQAGVDPPQIDVVLRTGGTSAVPIFRELLGQVFGEDKVMEMDLLTSVVGGLAIVAKEGGGSQPPYARRYDLSRVPVAGSIRAKSNRPYERYAFRIGAQCYRDRPYTVRHVPVELCGLPAIRTAQEDKGLTARLFMQFDLGRASRVYVAYDAEAPSIPNWLREYKLQEMRIVVDQTGTRRDFVVFAKDFEPGCVKLGGNRAAGQTGDVFMNYFVVIKARL